MQQWLVFIMVRLIRLDTLKATIRQWVFFFIKTTYYIKQLGKKGNLRPFLGIHKFINY